MSLLAAVGIGVLCADFFRPKLAERTWLAAVALASLAWMPWMTTATGLAGGLLWWRRRLARRRRQAEEAEQEVLVLAELVALGLAAGLPFGPAMAVASEELASDLASEVRAVLRAARLFGLESALGASDGVGAGFFQLAARAVTTGAPLRPAIDSFAQQRRGEERAKQLSAARRLPVRLMLPLALLILPGFVLLTLGPALVGALNRVAIALPPVVGRSPI